MSDDADKKEPIKIDIPNHMRVSQMETLEIYKQAVDQDPSLIGFIENLHKSLQEFLDSRKERGEE